MTQKNTYVADQVIAVDSMMQTDLACKRVLASKEILARILRGVVKEYANCTEEDIKEKYLGRVQLFTEVTPGMTNRTQAEDECAATEETIKSEQTEDKTPNEATVYFDVKVTTLLPKKYRNKAQVFLHVDVEAQKEYRPGYPIEKRGVYYISRLISSQLVSISEDTDYNKLQKVYGIWICLGKDIPKKEQQSITRYFLAKEDLVGEAAVEFQDYDLLELIVIRLGDKETDNRLLGMLQTLLWKRMSVKDRLEELEGKYGIPMKRELKEEVGRMCTYSYAITERAREDGIQQGLQDGIEKGTERLNRLILRLMSEKRFEDLKRAAEDGEYREKLYKEFGIELSE